MERNEDLTKVFDRTWKANHNNDVKEARSREKKFWNKMLNVKDNGNANTGKIVTPNMQVNNLQKNINDAANFQKRNNINNIVKKWK